MAALNILLVTALSILTYYKGRVFLDARDRRPGFINGRRRIIIMSHKIFA